MLTRTNVRLNACANVKANPGGDETTQHERKKIMVKRSLAVCLFVFAFAVFSSAQEGKSVEGQGKKTIPAGSKVYVAPMKDGFETFVIAGIMKKQVPVVI